MRRRRAGALAVLGALLSVTACSQPVPGTPIAAGAAPPTTGATSPGDSAHTPELVSSGAHLSTPRQADVVPPCAIATEAQVVSTLGAVTGPPAPLPGSANSCLWPLLGGNESGFLTGYGVSFSDVAATHPAEQGGLERATDGNSTWLWCERSDARQNITCGAAVAISAERTFVTGLVRPTTAGRTTTTVLAELQQMTIPLLRSLPAL